MSQGTTTKQSGDVSFQERSVKKTVKLPPDIDGKTKNSRNHDAGGSGQGPGFIHLHVHSAYSLLEGAIQPKRLQELAIADGQPALAITDRNNLFGALEFSEKATNAASK